MKEVVLQLKLQLVCNYQLATIIALHFLLIEDSKNQNQIIEVCDVEVREKDIHDANLEEKKSITEETNATTVTEKLKAEATKPDAVPCKYVNAHAQMKSSYYYRSQTMLT